MCGIVAFASRSPSTNVIESVLEAYGGQASRGQKGFGLTIAGSDCLTKTYRATHEAVMLLHMLDARNNFPAIRAALFHHRYPTSTKNTISGTHPFMVSHDTELNYEHVIVHNGVLSNEFSLAKGHRANGYKYGSQDGKVFNDSEAGAIEFARAVENPEYIIQAQGSQAYVSLVLEKETSKALFLMFGTNGDNPLIFLHKNRSIQLASELSVGVKAEENKLYAFDFSTGKLSARELKFVPEPPRTYYRYGVQYTDDATLIPCPSQAIQPASQAIQPTPMGLGNRVPHPTTMGLATSLSLSKRVDVDKHISQAGALLKAYRDLLVRGQCPSPKATAKRLYGLLELASLEAEEQFSEALVEETPRYRRVRGGI